MNPAETAELLAMCAAYDGRKVGKIDVAAWHAVVADLGIRDAKDAVVAYYRDETRWMMPAHVVKGVKAIRERRLAGVTSEAIAESLGIAGDDPRYLEKIQAHYARIADGVQAAPPRALEAGR